jgi:hypothetical protein
VVPPLCNQSVEELFDILGQAQLGEIVEMALFCGNYEWLGTKRDIAPEKDRPEFPRQAIEQFPQANRNMLAGMVVSPGKISSRGCRDKN